MGRRLPAVLYRRPRTMGALSPRMWYPGMSCIICGEKVRPWQAFNWDHVVPISKGGPRGKKNKAIAHLLCNSVKNDRHPFSLRTLNDREAVRPFVSTHTYERLLRIWAGETA